MRVKNLDQRQSKISFESQTIFCRLTAKNQKTVHIYSSKNQHCCYSVCFTAYQNIPLQNISNAIFCFLTVACYHVHISLGDSTGYPKYDQQSYHNWIDKDRDFQNGRHKVLIEGSTTVVFKSSKISRVVSGNWKDLYSRRTITDTTKLNIDQVVPLKETYESGVANWS